MSREYFLDDSESKYKDAYLRYMISIAKLLGANDTHAEKEMTEVLDFEVKLANVRLYYAFFLTDRKRNESDCTFALMFCFRLIWKHGI